MLDIHILRSPQIYHNNPSISESEYRSTCKKYKESKGTKRSRMMASHIYLVSVRKAFHLPFPPHTLSLSSFRLGHKKSAEPRRRRENTLHKRRSTTGNTFRDKSLHSPGYKLFKLEILKANYTFKWHFQASSPDKS
jgi:hypothetical protein